jgi:putative SOS response-associated peptidase YedK
MLFAGLYDCTVLEGEKDPFWTFTIVTTAANKDFEWLHERQPVILSSRTAIDSWLDTSAQTWTNELTKLVQPYHDPASPLEWCVYPRSLYLAEINVKKTAIEYQKRLEVSAVNRRHLSSHSHSGRMAFKQCSPK